MGGVTIKVITAVRAKSETRKKIEETFRAKHKNSEVEFVYQVSPEVIGGVLIVDGETYYDGTIKAQLAKIKDLVTDAE